MKRCVLIRAHLFLQQQIDKFQSVAYNTSVRMIVLMKGVGFFAKQEEER